MQFVHLWVCLWQEALLFWGSTFKMSFNNYTQICCYGSHYWDWVLGLSSSALSSWSRTEYEINKTKTARQLRHVCSTEVEKIERFRELKGNSSDMTMTAKLNTYSKQNMTAVSYDVNETEENVFSFLKIHSYKCLHVINRTRNPLIKSINISIAREDKYKHYHRKSTADIT